MNRQTNLTLSQFKKALSKCNGLRVALDTETTGLYWWRDKLVTVGFHCPDAGLEGTIDLGVPADVATPEELDQFQEEVRTAIQETLKPGTTVVMHNSKFDLSMMGVSPEDCYGWKIVDVPVMIHLLDSRYKKSLEQAERTLLGSNSKRAHIERAPEDRKIRKKVWLWPSDVRQDYCLNDTIVTYQLAVEIAPLLKKMELWELFLKEMNYIKQIYYTEHLGIYIDQEFIGQAMIALQGHRMELEQQLWDAVGYQFNWRSHKKLSYALYENLGIDKPVNPFAIKGQNTGYQTRFGFKRVMELKGGMYNETMTSTFLLMEKVHHPLGELVAALREADKLAKQLALWLKLVDDKGYIHSNFNMTGTRTGRLSSSKPNLANIPSDVRGRFTQGVFTGGITRTNEYNLRKAYVALPGYLMLSIDYRQMEMRFFGVESQDESLLDFLASGKDIHLMIAIKVWGDCGAAENKIHREWSKTIAFGLIYGMTTGSLEHKLDMTRAQAQKVIEDYWGAFPRIRPWLFEVIQTCKQQGFLRYWSGRVWREEEEMFMYKGANAKVQGGCADLLSIAAMRTHKWFHTRPTYYGDIVSYIYDELLMQVKIEHIEETANAIAEIMQVPDLFDLPFLTDCKVGTSYGDLVEMKNTDGVWKLPQELRQYA